jgi:hypothetical protein
MIKIVILCAMVVAAFPVGPGDAARVSSAHDYEGFWRNTHPKPGFIKFLEIAAADVDKLKIRAWLRCNPLSVRIAMLKDCQQWRSDSVLAEPFVGVVGAHPERGVGRNVLALTGETLTVSTTEAGWYNTFKRVLGDAVSCLGGEVNA